MRKLKKTLIILAIVAVVGCGGFFGWKYFRQSSAAPVKVLPFSFVGMTEYWGDSRESYGPVTTDKIQTVYLSDTQTVSKILVKEGQEVKKGDLLMSFDTSLSQLELERKELEIQKDQMDLDDANKELQRISWMVPMGTPPTEPETEPTEPDPGRLLEGEYELFQEGHDGSSESAAFISWIPGGQVVTRKFLLIMGGCTPVQFTHTPAELTLTVYPADADANSAIAPEADGTYLLLPGEYAYEAAAKDHEPAQGRFTVPKQMDSFTVDVTLTPPATEPTETEPTETEPTEEPTEAPTENPTEPTDPSAPTDPSNPTDPTTDPTTPSDPTQTPSEPSQPAAEKTVVRFICDPENMTLVVFPKGKDTDAAIEAESDKTYRLLPGEYTYQASAEDYDTAREDFTVEQAELEVTVTLTRSAAPAPVTEAPTEKPTEAATEAPTQQPTENPTQTPTEKPTEAAVETPTQQPAETETPPAPAPEDPPAPAPAQEEPTPAPASEAPTAEEPIAPPAPETAELTGEEGLIEFAAVEPGTVPTGSQARPATCQPYYVIFKITRENRLKGDILGWIGLHVYSDGSFTFFDASMNEDFSIPVEPTVPTEPEPEIDYIGSGYTYTQIQAMKEEQLQKIKDLELKLKLAGAELKIMQKELSDGNIYAEQDGKVISVLTEEEAKLNSQPIIKVTGGGGYYIDASISELERSGMKVGMEVTVNDWDTGMTYTGTVVSVGDMPSSSSSYNGMNNPNASSYPFRVFVDESADLQAGHYVSVQYSTGEQTGIYLEKAFLRTDNGRSYVYVLGENGLLEQRTVQVGRNLNGYYVEILDGLTEDDMVAFPYGKNVKAGAPAEEGDYSDLYG